MDVVLYATVLLLGLGLFTTLVFVVIRKLIEFHAK